MIAFTHYSAPQDISGVTTWLQDFAVQLQRSGEDVAINLHHFGVDPQKASVLRPLRLGGVAVTVRSIPSATEDGVRDVLKFLNRYRPTLYLPQCLPAAHFAARIAASKGLPWIFTLHSDDPAYWALADLTGPRRGQGAWVAVSEAIATVVRARYPDVDVRVIPCGVAIPDVKSTAGWNPRAFRVVYSGRVVEEQKRISKVIACLIAFCRSCPEAEAVIIGEGPARPRMEVLVAEAGLSARIRFTGRIEPDQVTEELAKAQAILLMSDYEGLPVAILEAMARGVVPVVRSIRSGIPEIVHQGKTGLLIDEAGDEQAAARVLLSLFQREDSWRQMSNAARDLVAQKYSRDACLAKWMALIDELRSRCTASYPLAIPKDLQLPPVDARLKDTDRRKPPLAARLLTLVERLKNKLLRLWRD